MRQNPIIGISLSHPHLSYVGVPFSLALNECSKFKLNWVRLGCCWSEIEKKEGEYDYSVMNKMLKICDNLKIKVVMTVGMKAPRWPEFYFPPYITIRFPLHKNQEIDLDNVSLTKPLFSYITYTIKTLRQYECIQCWQVENEPFDPSGPLNIRISEKLLQKEIELIRTNDPPRAIAVNIWGNELEKRGYFPKATEYADIVGLDMYSHIPTSSLWRRKGYIGPRDTNNEIKKIISNIQKYQKKVWISELQAEPWGDPESFTPEHIIQNAEWVKKWEPDGVFFWGFEYWLKQKIKGNSSYWDAAQKAVKILSL